MRDVYHEQLDLILPELEDMTRTVAAAVRRSTAALLTVDLTQAEQVIAADADVDATREAIEEQIFELIARQAPVATELRMLIAAWRMVADLERMGDLSVHIAKVARLRYPAAAIPPELSSVIEQMGSVAGAMVTQVGDLLHSRDVQGALALDATDDEMDKLRSSQFRLMMDDSWPYGVETAVDIALLGRYYERIADHAVIIGDRVSYILTGDPSALAAEIR